MFMPNPLVGSVTAQLLLDTEKFNTSISKVQSQVRELNVAFRGTNAREMAESITKLEEQLEKNTQIIKQQEEVIDRLKASYDSTKSEMESLIQTTEKLNAESKKAISTNNEISSSNEQLGRSFDTLKSKKRSLDEMLSKPSKSFLSGLTKEFASGFNVSNLNLDVFENRLLKVLNQGFRADGSQFIRSISSVTTKTIGEIQELVAVLVELGGTFETVMNEFGGESAVLSRYGDAVQLSAEKTANFQSTFSRFNPILHEVMSNLQQATLKYNELEQSMRKSLGTVQHGYGLEGMVEPIEQVVAHMNRLNEETARAKEHFNELVAIARKGLVSLENFHNLNANFNQLVTTARNGLKMAEELSPRVVTAYERLQEKLKETVVGFAQLTEASRTTFMAVEFNAKKGVTAVENFHNRIQRKISLANTYSGLSEELNKVISYLERVAQKEREINNQRVAEKQAEIWRKGAEAVEKYHAQIQKLIEIENQLSSTESKLSSVINNGSGAMTREKEAVAQLTAVYKNADANLIKFAEAQARLGNTLTSTNPKFAERISHILRVASAESQASASATKLGSSYAQASAKANTLTGATTKLQSVLSSTKMILSTLSSMFIWTFGMSLYEATKQTVESKNEMESYLHQMGMGEGSINLFNRGLDETAEKFKKLNKYMIGETIAGIGMEFDLTANQMKKSMDVVAMIQNEYVRAGRKEEEATLAVKDILQGEFLRLSRETGVGKNELIDTGLWSGDLKDIEGLMEALRKVGTDRHWDLFASKCNSLNDVISETKNRISEFGASLVDQLSPAIINGFNIIVDSIDAVTSTWNNFDPMQKIAVGLPTLFAFGTALMMVAGNLSLVDIAQMGYTQSLLATLLRLDVATVKEYGLATAIGVKVTSLNAETVAYAGNLTSMFAKITGLDAYILKEYGLSTAINVATGTLDMNTISHDANAVAQAFSNGVTEEGTAVVGGFTVVKELEEAVMTSDTAQTEFNTIAHEMNAKVVEEETVSIWGLISAMSVLEAITVATVIIGIAVALGSLWMEAERAKEAVEGFYDIVDNGDDYINDYKGSIESLGKQYDELGTKIEEAKAKGEDTWSLEQTRETVKANKEVAETNLRNIEAVNESAKKSAEDFRTRINNANIDFERRNSKIFEKLGYDSEEATEKANNFIQQYLDGMEQMETATQEYTMALDNGSHHMESQVDILQNMGADQETLVKYTKDYGEEVLKNAQYHKEWAEGDFWAIFKIGLSDAKLALIDFSYYMGQFEWWKDLCHALGDESQYITENFREWTSLQFDRIGQLANDFEKIYNTIKAIDDYWNHGDDSGLMKMLSDNENGDWTTDGQFDLEKYKEYMTNWLDTNHTLTGTNWLLEILMPKPAKDEINGRMHEIHEGISESIVTGVESIKTRVQGLGLDIFKMLFGIFNTDGGEEGGSGVAKTIPENNLISQLIHSWVGDDPWGAVQSAVDMYIMQPFAQAIQLGFLNIPIVGDILSLLGLIDTTSPTAQQKGDYLAQNFGWAIEQKIRNIPILGDILAMLGIIDSSYPTAHSKGDNVGRNVHDGVNTGKQGTADLVRNEMWELIGAVANAIGEAYNTACRVGQAILDGINSVIQHHSPGIPAQLIGAEMNEIELAIANSVDSIFLQAQAVGSAINTGIQPSGEITFDAEAMAQYQADMMMAMGMAGETVDTSESAFSQLDYTTALTFSNIGTTIGTTMLNIANSTKLNYNNIALTTKTQLANMQSQTTKNIGAIRQSWTGMQIALINSAEHIRSETGAKIQSLQNNMASFWRKVQNPALLLGAGNPSEQKRVAPQRRYTSHTGGVRKVLRPSGYAGGGNNSSSSNRTRGGIMKYLPNVPDSNKLEQIKSLMLPIINGLKSRKVDLSKISMEGVLADYFMCLLKGEGECVAGKKHFAGGWDFDWAEDIKQALLTWHTHFGDIYDPYLYVGKFENDDFPIRGIAPIALNYIQDAIGRTTYEFYWNGKYGDPLSIWNAGHFNCWDGAILVMALARALGFPNSHMVHGTWGGLGHVWAYVEGLGNIDATAIQGGYGLMAPSRTGVAGSPSLQKRFKHNHVPSDDSSSVSNTFGDVHIHIDGTGKDKEEIGQEVRNVMVDLMSPNPATGI